jgi:hypothetical protein
MICLYLRPDAAGKRGSDVGREAPTHLARRNQPQLADPAGTQPAVPFIHAVGDPAGQESHQGSAMELNRSYILKRRCAQEPGLPAVQVRIAVRYQGQHLRQFSVHTHIILHLADVCMRRASRMEVTLLLLTNRRSSI